MTDVNYIINGCDYGSKFRSDSLETYQKNELIQSIIYTANGDDICLDIQTSQNLNSNGIESKGSSYKYTLDIQNGGNLINLNKNHKDEQENFCLDCLNYFGEVNKNINNFDSKCNALLILILIIILIYLVNNYLRQ